MAQPYPYKLPTPPSSRPSSSQRSRCKSLRPNIKQIPRQQPPPSDLDKNHNNNVSDTNLSKYSLLPAIGCNNLSEKTFDKTSVKHDSNEQKKASNEGHSKTIDIAVRLLDGSRRQHCFTSSHTFKDILKYLMSVANTEAVTCQCEFVSCEVPQQVFSDLSVSLGQADIKTRTLLCLQEIDPD